MHQSRDFFPLYERISDYLFNMSALTRREARQQWRESIKEAWNNRCAYCGRPPIDDESLTVDHIRPKSRGGEDRTSNCRPACAECNQAKSSSDWLAWFKMQPFYSIEAELRIRQWLSTGNAHFSQWDEDDAKTVEAYAEQLLGEWPTSTPDKSANFLDQTINELSQAQYLLEQ
jgi:hypothetical protein